MRNHKSDICGIRTLFVLIRNFKFLLMNPDGLQKDRHDQIRAENRINDLTPFQIPDICTCVPGGRSI